MRCKVGIDYLLLAREKLNRGAVRGGYYLVTDAICGTKWWYSAS